MPTFTVDQIAARVNGQVLGAGSLPISGVDQINEAGPEQVTFVRDARRAAAWPTSKAGAVLANADLDVQPTPGRAVIKVADADLALALTLEMFAPAPVLPDPGIPGVHPRAFVDPSAVLGKDVRVGAGAFIGPGSRLGDGCVVHANVVIQAQCVVGPNCTLDPGVVIYDRCELGSHVHLHGNVVVGGDGFGYRPSPDGRSLVKIPHIGIVRIGNHVEIGSGTCIDRAKFSATVIGDGTKIDNLCQIAHNCRVGRCCVIAGNTGLAGSVTLGDGVMIGGCAILRDHITVGAGAKIAGASVVGQDVPAGETWGGYHAQEIGAALREHVAVRKLPGLLKELRRNKKP
ncbi:MAG: UDP-3-O-(3-hydroxymyristoyl)glucosamine N-acyltransferase [Planctomycetota bacterium]|nr:UDP-3-O-(3-hydroxymyristoyl)glucosamine N-acyltransferase [Planctomycetota bacterium]